VQAVRHPPVAAHGLGEARSIGRNRVDEVASLDASPVTHLRSTMPMLRNPTQRSGSRSLRRSSLVQ
jgi:hypothetical protein